MRISAGAWRRAEMAVVKRNGVVSAGVGVRCPVIAFL